MAEGKNEAAVSLGNLAGKKNRKRGKAFFSEIGKKGASLRWKKGKKKAP